MYFDKDIEKMPPEKLTEIQLERLNEMLKRIYAKVPFYRTRFEEKGFTSQNIKNLADLTKLPFTTRQDIGEQYPYGLMTIPLSSLVRIHFVEAEDHKFMLNGYTKDDQNMLTGIIARGLAAGGVTMASVVQVALDYALSVGGLGFHYAAADVGAAVIPAGGLQINKHLQLIDEVKTTVFIGSPTQLEEIYTMDSTSEQTRLLATVFCWAEKLNKEQRQRLRAVWGERLYEVYGLSEIIGPGIASECNAHQGLHIQEDHFYPEVINPATGKVLPEGESGELVITTLTKQGMPLLRYRTGDRIRLIRDRCRCGRTTARMFFE